MHSATPERISDLATAGGVVIRSPLSAADARAALTQAGRRGRVPGFDAVGSDGFRIDCDAVPFEHVLLGVIEPSSDGRSTITLRTQRRRLMPGIFAATLALTVWPGVWLTDSLLGVYWSAYGVWSEQMPWLTYAWYLPIAVLPLPWVWRSLTRRSRAMAAESAAKLVETLRSVVDAALTD